MKKKNAILLNVARAPLVAEEALYTHEREPRIQAGFDVWWKEPTWAAGSLHWTTLHGASNIAGPHNSNRYDHGREATWRLLKPVGFSGRKT